MEDTEIANINEKIISHGHMFLYHRQKEEFPHMESHRGFGFSFVAVILSIQALRTPHHKLFDRLRKEHAKLHAEVRRILLEAAKFSFLAISQCLQHMGKGR